MKLNPTGKYNMKFIDWENEWEAVYEHLGDPNSDVNPCGLDEKVFEQLIVLRSITVVYRDTNSACIPRQRTD